MLLWLVVRGMMGGSDAAVWTVYESGWFQSVIAPLHAIPVAAAIWIVARRLRSAPVESFAASLLAHDALDLPFHGRDAHPHFYPFSNWRFVSPLSYWDLGHHARYVAAFELGCIAMASAVLWLRFPTRPARALLLATDASLVLFFATGWAFWDGTLAAPR